MFPYCSRHEQAMSPTATVRLLLLPEDPRSNPIIGIFYRTSITAKTVEQTKIRKRHTLATLYPDKIKLFIAQ